MNLHNVCGHRGIRTKVNFLIWQVLFVFAGGTEGIWMLGT